MRSDWGMLPVWQEILNGELGADWLQDVKGEELQSSPTTAIWGRQKRYQKTHIDPQNLYTHIHIYVYISPDARTFINI